MANLSAIKLPNGTTYNLKDSISGYTTNTGTITKIQTTAGAHTTVNVSSGAVSFNVPTHTSHLTNDSGYLTNSTLYEANLQWGGKDFSAAYGCIDAAMIDVLGANRFAFLKAAGLTIEYSTNGGSSWTTYSATDAQKVGLFSSGQNFYLGAHTTAGSCTTNDRLRVTIATSAAGIYTVLNKIAIYMSTSGSTVQVLIERALESTPTTYVTHKDWTNISGWSGWNILNISGLTTYGNTASSQYGRIRFTFKATAVNTNYSAASISKIMGFGGVGWSTPSNMAAIGHLYSYDSSQNAYFPAQITATQFNGNVTGSAGSVAWSGVGSKPTTLSGYGITDAKIANGVITLGSNTITPLTSHQTVSNKNATLAWATTSTIATIGSTDIKVTMPANPDTNTHRPIQMNGTEILGNNTTALNLKAGTNVSLSNSSGTVTIAATDTTYSSQAAASGGTAVSLVTTGEKYTWNNKQNALTNPVTGTGTSGQLAQWNGTSTITSGPKVTISTSTPSGGTNGDIWFVYS